MIRDLLTVFAVWSGISTGFFAGGFLVAALLKRLERLRERRAFRDELQDLADEMAKPPEGPHGDVHDAFYFPAGDREAMLAILRTMAPRALEN